MSFYTEIKSVRFVRSRVGLARNPIVYERNGVVYEMVYSQFGVTSLFKMVSDEIFLFELENLKNKVPTRCKFNIVQIPLAN